MRSPGAIGIAVLVATLAAGCRGVDNTTHVEPLRALLAAVPDWAGDGKSAERLWRFETRFYEARGYHPAWIDGDRPAPQLDALLTALRGSERHGLDPTTYGVAEVEHLLNESNTRFRGVRLDPAHVPELDARLTLAYLRYAADLLGWSGDPRAIHPDWIVTRQDQDLAARLANATGDGNVAESLEELAPTHRQYKGLQVALAEERKKEGGRADIIRINMERWRWTPRELGERYVLVNVPAYQLQVMEGDTPALAMRVIVGAPETPTPLFSDRMTYVVFSPYWNIPESILRDETLPKVSEDPEYLTRAGIEIVSRRGGKPIDPESIDWSDEEELSAIRFRQVPGPENALGLVKFIFPNNFSVYLHDTPTDRLFSAEERALSHGCIRVENPVALARYVLGDRPQWNEDRILAAMHAEQEQTVKLRMPLPVHIGYWTAWVGPDGKTVTYTDDPYGLDAKALATS